MHLSPLCLSALCLLSGLALTLPARADDPDPSIDLFKQGLEAMKAKRFYEGCPKLEQSYQLKPRPGTLFTLAECEAQRERIATAVRLYEEYLRLFETLSPEEQAVQKEKDRPTLSKDARDKLKPLLPLLTLMLPPNAPQGTLVRRNGTDLAAAEIGVAIPVDPGEYSVVTQAHGGPVKEVKVKIGQGEKQSITLEVMLPPAAESSPPAHLPPVQRTGWQEVVDNKGVRGPPLSTSPPPPPPMKSVPLIVAGAGLTAVAAGIGVALMVVGGNEASEADALLVDLKKKAGEWPCSSGRVPQDCAKLHQFRMDSDAARNAGVGMFIGAGVVGLATLMYALWPMKRVEPPRQQQRPQGLSVVPVVGGGMTGGLVTGRF